MRALVIGLLLATLGCPADPDPPVYVPPTQGIGTWPTPEMNALGEERCDGLDNDGDGSVDEGCGCIAPRSCVLISADRCVAGTQACDGNLEECGSPATDLGAAGTASVAITGVSPAVLTPLDASGPVVTVAVESRCAGIVAPYAIVLLEAQVPTMRVWAVARDDGVAPDTAAGDSVYSTELINPFGPGVPTQTMTVEVGVRLHEEWLLDQATLDFQAE